MKLLKQLEDLINEANTIKESLSDSINALRNAAISIERHCELIEQATELDAINAKTRLS